MKINSTFHEKCLVYKDYYLEGFQIDPDLSTVPESAIEHAKHFNDSRHKVLIDNTAPYGHFITEWLYALLTELDSLPTTPEDTLILIFKDPKDPGSQLNHMSTVTEYVHDRLIQKGYGVSYVDSQYFYVTNYYHFIAPFHAPQMLLPHVVGRFLAEDITTSSYGRKIYLSRSKTTTSNGNAGVYIKGQIDHNLEYKENLANIRENNKYKFSDRIDDEERLEHYLESLGFEVLTPEDFDSYHEQLKIVAEAKVLVSLTSSALHSLMVTRPEARIVEICTPIPTHMDSQGKFLSESASFHDHYRSIALARGNGYIAIPNASKKAEDVINHIESTSDLKFLFSS
jgi:hypothetical protein